MVSSDVVIKLKWPINRYYFETEMGALYATGRKFMLRGHREFIEDLKKHVHLRDFGNDILFFLINA